MPFSVDEFITLFFGISILCLRGFLTAFFTIFIIRAVTPMLMADIDTARLLTLLVLTVLPNFLGDINHVIERASIFDHEDISHFFICECNIHMRTNLEEQVDSVDERYFLNVFTLDLEEVLLVQFTVCNEEVTTKPCELLFDESFDASILNDIHVAVCKSGFFCVATYLDCR